MIHNLYRLSNIVRMIKSRKLRWARHLARMESGRSAFKILTGKPALKRLLGRPRHRWEDNIRMDLKEIVVNTRNWIDSAWDRYYWRALEKCGIKPPYAMVIIRILFFTHTHTHTHTLYTVYTHTHIYIYIYIYG